MSYDINKFLQFENKLRLADNIQELSVVIVNQISTLISCEQVILFGRSINLKSKTTSISNISSVDDTSPFVQFMNELSDYLVKSATKDKTTIFSLKDLPENLRIELSEYGSKYMMLVPLEITKNNVQVSYHLLILNYKEFSQKEIELMDFLKLPISHSIFALRQCSIFNLINKKYMNSKYYKIIIFVMFLIMILPVKMSVLSPCEIVAKEPLVITSPMEGVIDIVSVQPNQFVNKGDLLVKLDKTDLKNNYLISLKKMESVKAELLTAKQTGFYNYEKKLEVAQLETQVELSIAEVNYAKSLLDKTEIISDLEGLAILEDPNEWKGKPVVTGERILLIANPNQVEIKIMLPVYDALFIENGSNVKIFLDNMIFKSWNGKINRISYKPQITSENTLAYQIIASFEDKDIELPKIGLRGTAKIYSNYVPLFYYLFHKPITWLRQIIGW